MGIETGATGAVTHHATIKPRQYDRCISLAPPTPNFGFTPKVLVCAGVCSNSIVCAKTSQELQRFMFGGAKKMTASPPLNFKFKLMAFICASLCSNSIVCAAFPDELSDFFSEVDIEPLLNLNSEFWNFK
ncbi:Hypothetical protein CINCED_3A017372 [Cinara cedri]|uniref:Uncharacterized protein n=1 Tax=Cinara cedri TaxID=506608 RepID=A0A5E4MIZ7_9HEMI|nr:Hypothetical protein CINCED_3A017372 [Cinara cedri]